MCHLALLRCILGPAESAPQCHVWACVHIEPSGSNHTVCCSSGHKYVFQWLMDNTGLGYK